MRKEYEGGEEEGVRVRERVRGGSVRRGTNRTTTEIEAMRRSDTE